MAFTQHGDQTYTFGFQDGAAAVIAATVGLKPQTLSISGEAEFTAEAQNENGEVAAVVVGPDKRSFTMSGYVVDAALLEAAGNFTYDGKFFIITGRKIDTSNSEFTKGEISGTSYSNITGS